MNTARTFVEMLCLLIRGTRGEEIRGAALKKLATITRAIGQRVDAKSFPALRHDEFHVLCRIFARRPEDCITSEHAMSGAQQSAVHTIQRDLHKINPSVPINGKLDAVTVDAINAVFNGWDDAPPSLRTGKLTAQKIARNTGTVAKFVRLAIRGATTFADVNTEGCC